MSTGETTSRTQNVLYIISCAGLPAKDTPNLVIEAQKVGWTVCVIATPHATSFLDIPLLAEITGYPVRSEYKRPEEPDALPRADALISFPLTFNTMSKWVYGMPDTLAIGLLCEYTGLKKPIIAVPCMRLGSGLDMHPLYFKHMDMLRSYGVEVIFDPEMYPIRNDVPPTVILKTLEQIIRP